MDAIFASFFTKLDHPLDPILDVEKDNG